MLENTRQQTLQDIRNFLRLALDGTRCLGFQQLSVGGVATHLTVPDGANSCTITFTNVPALTMTARVVS